MLAAFRLIWRRRRWRHGQPMLRRPLLWLLAMVLLFVATMAVFEEMAPGDSLWLAAVTLTTVGYGDITPRTGVGRLATVLFLLVGGVFLALSLMSFDRADPGWSVSSAAEQYHNAAGRIGAWAADLAHLLQEEHPYSK